MRVQRIITAAALTAAAGLVLSGCVLQVPAPAETQGSDPTATEAPVETSAAPSEDADLGAALVGTDWTGGVNYPGSEELSLRWQFEADGTLYIYDWADEVDVNFDSDADTWTVSGDTLTIYLSDIAEIGGLTFTGTAPTATELSLDGTDDVGDSGYTLTMTQQ